MKPRLLDLFCGAGGCSVGYARAGFEVVGLDIEPHPSYPFTFIQADVLDILVDLDFLRSFDVLAGSPPVRHSRTHRRSRATITPTSCIPFVHHF